MAELVWEEGACSIKNFAFFPYFVVWVEMQFWVSVGLKLLLWTSQAVHSKTSCSFGCDFVNGNSSSAKFLYDNHHQISLCLGIKIKDSYFKTSVNVIAKLTSLSFCKYPFFIICFIVPMPPPLGRSPPIRNLNWHTKECIEHHAVNALFHFSSPRIKRNTIHLSLCLLV